VPIKSFTTVMAVLLLSGCAIEGTYRPPKVQNQTDGAVVMRVLPNVDGGAAQFFKNWGELTVLRIPSNAHEQESRYMLRPTLDDTTRTAVYAAGLPPGSYRFIRFSSQQCGAICLNAWLDVGPEFSRFEIESGRLTDLGVIIQSTAPGERGKALLAHDSAADHPETPEIVHELIPDIAQLTQERPLSWTAASVPIDMAKLRNYTLTHSVGLVSPHPLEGGGFIYGTANGVLVESTPGHRLVSYDVGARSSIETVLVGGKGDWLVGGELGLLRISRDHGRTWQSIRGNIPFGVVVDLCEWHGEIIATTLRGKDVYIHAAAAGSSEWRELAHYQMDLNSFWDIPGVRAASFVVDDGLITTLPGRKMAYLDLNTGQSDIRALPGAIQMFSVSADGVLRCRCAATIAVNPYESVDRGKTWKDSSASRFMMMPTFRDDKHGVAFKGAMFAHPKMVYTNDGGLTWVESMDAPANTRQLFYSKDGSVAYLGTPYGTFWATRDDGKTWQSLQE
jgi:photosystem II stability/assembly factor-like uncharacterized protein